MRQHNSKNHRAASTSLASAYAFVVLFGIVSLFSDMTHEGARSITGPFLSSFGLSAAAVAFIAGFGEFVGYALRFVSGYLSDKTKRYWLITGIGYAINLLSVPLLALSGSWIMAAGLMILERAGRAIRNPARDAMLSHATSETGHGKGFGLHEALDQIGATAGPLIISAALVAAGLVDYPLLALHFQNTDIMKDSQIAIYYAIAMGTDASDGVWFFQYDIWNCVVRRECRVWPHLRCIDTKGCYLFHCAPAERRSILLLEREERNAD
jgi:MFS family permease